MNISLLDSSEYAKNIKFFSLYDSAEFVELNKSKADSVYYFLFSDEKPRFALVGGVRNNVLKLPFSSSFCTFSKLTHCRLEHYHEAVAVLLEWSKSKSIDSIVFSMPPLFYDMSHLSKVQNALQGNGFKISSFDLNFEYFLSGHDANYPDRIERCARKNCRRAEKECLVFEKTEDAEKAYEVIRINRKEKGFPLRMSLEDVIATSNIIPTDFFTVKTPTGEIAASAVVQRLDAKIVRVVYWGNPGKFEQLRPVNFLAWKLFDFYKEKNFEIVDIGISTVDGIPNYGLCAFKESIGCTCSPKITYKISLKTSGSEYV